MYAFFSIPGHADDLLTAKRLVAEAGLGLAPGSAFAPQAQGWLRWCFASKDPTGWPRARAVSSSGWESYNPKA
jgi:aspartate/methionine/tyrosine aminotransferase